jgi:membrane protein required for colicin V production
MWIDIVTVAILAYAGWQGFRKGVIMAVFSFGALFIGVAAAVKLSAVSAVWLSEALGMPSKWWPVLSFIAVLVVVSALVRNVGRLLEKTAEDVMLGPLNRMAGFVVFALLYLMLYSILLYYMDRLGLIRAEVRSASTTFGTVSAWGPAAIGMLGRIFPFLGDVFRELQEFFEGMSQKGSLNK